MRFYWMLVPALVAGCAAQPGARLEADDAVEKSEALVGAACVDDGGCDAWEQCNRIVCITTPCPSGGTCRDITRFTDEVGADIPDADSDGVTRTLEVARPASNVGRARVVLRIDHTWRGDLRVVLTSPSGTEYVVHDRAGESEDNLVASVDVTSAFEGESAVGEWTLNVSDNARQDVGRLTHWRLELEFVAPAPAPEPGRDIWSQVVVPTVASAHEYTNDTDQTWDLRPFSGGAARARVRFARLETERNYDFVEVVDMDSGDVLDRFTGTHAAFTTREYETGNLGIRLTSDYSITAWGFEMQHVEVFGLGCLADLDCGEGYQCPNELVRCIRFPCFLTCQPARAGGEGDGCASNSDCTSDLFCGGDGFCHADGSCDLVDDCNAPGNDWNFLRCMGYASCSAEGRCNYTCGSPLECTEGETRDDGCNTCSCSGGRWACTERYCPPVASDGEACGAGTICDTGLTCDQGRTAGATCSSDQPGICRTEGSRICTAEYAPVCACNGQTFSNECGRMGMAAFAHEGACALDVAIPDANVDGITRTIDVLAPSGGRSASVSVRIDHTWRGDLVVWVEDPDGVRHPLTTREGGREDDFEFEGSFDVGASGGRGGWTLHVSDHASYDTGVLRFFNVRVR